MRPLGGFRERAESLTRQDSIGSVPRMSTKIWVAYKLLDNKHLWHVIHDIRLRASKEASRVLRDLYDTMVIRYREEMPAQYRAEWEGRKQKSDFDEYYDLLSIVQRAVRQEYKSQLGSYQLDLFDFDAYVHVRYYGGVYSFIPASNGLFRHIFDFMEKDARLADWHYQNQSDRAEGISDDEWDARKAYYDAMDAQDVWQDVLMLPICDWQSFQYLDPWLDMAKEHFANKKKIKDSQEVRT